MSTIVLGTTSQSITIEMTGAATTTNPSVVAIYSDNTSTAFTPGPQASNLNGTTPVTVVSAPAASTQRMIKDIIVHNRDTASVTIIVKFVDGASSYILDQPTLAVKDKWTLKGTYDSSGNFKQIAASSAQVIADTIHAATGKTTPVDADEFGIWDSAASALKKLTWANLKATLFTGVTDGSSAATGKIGEYPTEGTASGVAFPATDVWGDAASISLTAGDWDVSLNFVAYMQGTTGATYINSGISSTSGNSATGLTLGSNQAQVNRSFAADEIDSIPVVAYRVSISGTTTYYAKMRAGYTGGTPNVYCRLSARRVR